MGNLKRKSDLSSSKWVAILIVQSDGGCLVSIKSDCLIIVSKLSILGALQYDFINSGQNSDDCKITFTILNIGVGSNSS